MNWFNLLKEKFYFQKSLPLIAIFSLLFFSPYLKILSKEDLFSQWKNFSKTQEAETLILWLKCKLKENLIEKKCRTKLKIKVPDFHGSLGIFVTIMIRKKVRGCFGAFFHKSFHLETVLSEYLKGALFNDPRYEPLGIENLENAQIIVTVAKRPFPINNPELVDISKYGIMITDAQNVIRIIVPMEIKSINYLLRKIKKLKIIQVHAFEAIAIKLF